MGQLSFIGNPRILLVSGDDCEPFIDLMDLYGAEMIQAKSASEGLEKLRSEVFDAVFVYVYLMPGISADGTEEFCAVPIARYLAGLRLIELIKTKGFKSRRTGKAIPIVVMNTVPVMNEIISFVEKNLGENDLHFFPPGDSMKIVLHLNKLI